jgi:hypothetical protein
MKKKVGGYNDTNIDNDSINLSRTQQDNAILSDLSPIVLVNNLTHSLSNCGPVTLSATNGCSNNDINNDVNYLYMPSSRGGKLNKMKNTSDNIFLEGGCYTCPQGQRGLNIFSRKFIVIIPLLYNKYKKGDVKSFDKTVKKLTKPAKKPAKKPTEKSKKRTRRRGGGNLDFTDLSGLDFTYKEYIPPDLGCANKYQPL